MKAKQGSLTRKEREFLRHRQEIVDAALDLFSEKGFHNVTMHEIAGEAEFAVGTLYKFFANKEDLYKALILEKSREFHSGLLKSIESGTDEIGTVRQYLETLIAVFNKNLRFVRLYFAETRGARFNIGAGLDLELRAMHQEILKALAKIFQHGIRRGLFRRLDPFLLATALDGVTHAFLIQYLEDPEEHTFDADLIITLFFKGVVIRGKT